MPTSSPGLKAVFSYYQTAVKVTQEGDVSMSDDSIQGLGTTASFLSTYLFGAIAQIASAPLPRQELPPSPSPVTSVMNVTPSAIVPSMMEDGVMEVSRTSIKSQIRSVLTEFVPDPGYFLAGGISGVASRTTTAPLDRLKVYLIAQTGVAQEAVSAAKSGAPVEATKQASNTLRQACKELWAAGGIKSLFAGASLICSALLQRCLADLSKATA